jgi:tetratricopeptide (TPR) repeat protein
VAFTAVLASALPGCNSSAPQTFEKAAAEATDALVAQTGKLPAFLARIEGAIAKPDPKEPKKSIVLDPMLDTLTGQQTETTALLERRVVQRMGNNFPQFEFMPFKTKNLEQAQFLLTGTLSRSPGDGANRHVRLNLALTDLRSGIVVAQASALARGDHLDETPSRYYKDSPVIIRDKVVEGYARTTETPAGQRADSYYVERIGAASVIQEATALYNQERYQDALGTYRQALATPAGAQLRAESGVYLSNMKLGRTADAEAAFGRIVSLGLAYNELGVKFLFAPGSVDFWGDPKISGAYPMWLRQIGREAIASGRCMTVVGHTSKTGAAAANEAVSLKRAAYIRTRLAAEQPALATKVKAEGMGFRQNIVGSGTDDAFDVLDRRVDFRIVPCAS